MASRNRWKAWAGSYGFGSRTSRTERVAADHRSVGAGAVDHGVVYRRCVDIPDAMLARLGRPARAETAVGLILLAPGPAARPRLPDD